MGVFNKGKCDRYLRACASVLSRLELRDEVEVAFLKALGDYAKACLVVVNATAAQQPERAAKAQEWIDAFWRRFDEAFRNGFAQRHKLTPDQAYAWSEQVRLLFICSHIEYFTGVSGWPDPYNLYVEAIEEFDLRGLLSQVMDANNITDVTLP
jgi:hypothetical protein